MLTEKQIGELVKTQEFENHIVELVNTNEKANQKVTAGQVHAVINAFKQAVCDCLDKGGKVQLTGFLTFAPIYRAPRNGINMLTNEPYTSPEKASVSLKMGELLKKSTRNITGDRLQELKNLKK